MPINAASVVIGLSYASLLFLISVGLSVVFGLMRFVNLATGALYIVGGYVAWSVANRTDNFWLALPAGAIMALIIGVVIERGFLDRLLGKELMQVSLTRGVAYTVSDVMRRIWGGDTLLSRAIYLLQVPPSLVTMHLTTTP